ncbi:50S ribosomal protein YmL27 [Annulohypoxylon maeteangense]|uniref:50S ribosomal protein YmL27 n=1 Tax=Annulohypoxylon maeteangense TaxID=1927788 RepID=UPI002007B9A8|nr:50S ribosomal protein YmL27 [Annulohypoxylon maeteangense]KAI0887826.1 50S ribosomal protein YmL27 [Annulohypoxylon maeteangense]
MQPTQPLLKAFRKFRLTTKDVNKGFYKGTRTGRMGSHTKYGGYVIDWSRVRTFVVPPNLSKFKLTPYVTQLVREKKGRYEGYQMGPKSAELYLDRWKQENGLD